MSKFNPMSPEQEVLGAFVATELEERLIADDGESIADAILQPLLAKVDELNRYSASGLAPKEFRKAELALSAVKAACDVLYAFMRTTPIHTHSKS